MLKTSRSSSCDTSLRFFLARQPNPATDPKTPSTRCGGRVLYVLLFIEVSTRKVHVAGRTANPHGAWVTQQARNFTFHLDERTEPLKFLIHDRDRKFSGSFDQVFATDGVRVLRTPIRAPKANAVAERWVRTVREECLDWVLITGRRHLEAVLQTYVNHYNHARPHRGLELSIPERNEAVTDLPPAQDLDRRDRLGGLIHEYYRAA